MPKLLFSSLLISLFLINLVSASFISLTTQIQVNSTSLPEEGLVSLTMENKGDEPAMAVQPEIEFTGKSFLGEATSQLDPGSSRSWNIPISTTLSTAGRYPLILKTRYYDLNNYAFSSISPSYVVIKEDTSPLVFGTLKTLEMSDSGKLPLEIINLDENLQKNIKLKLHLPKELTSDNSTLQLTMKPKSKANYEFNIERFSALPGSNYVIAAILEYDENNKHYTNILRGNIKLVENSPSPIKLPVTIILVIIIIIAFISIIILLEVRRKKKLAKEQKNEQPAN